ncbi:hypothetical protein ACIA8G_27885 [Lentzea sp. NPDC051213]|uniref:hypothetical protein n=1 Tax=Lentzea sp. NPDC051213 TaxID=3364126 RepID=UPI0037A159DF
MSDETRSVEDEMVRWAMSDVAPMSDDAFGRGRAALMARIAADEARAGESGEPGAEDTGVGAGTGAGTGAGAGAGAGETGTVVLLASRRRRRIPLVAAAAAMVLIAGAALLVPSLTSRDKGPSVGSAAAASVLNKAANATGDAKLLPGQYLYVLMYARWSAADNEYKWMYLQDQTLQTWIPADRTGTWLYRRNKTGDKQWLIGSQQDIPAGLPPIETEGEWRSEGGRALEDKIPVSFRDPTPEYIADLPRDPRELYERLRREAGSNGDERRDLLRMVTDGLDTGMYPAEVRSATYKALTYLPGLEIVDRTAVLDSREGTALGITTGDTTVQIVVNPETGDYLGSRMVQARDANGLKAGTVFSLTSVTTKVVSGIGQPN